MSICNSNWTEWSTIQGVIEGVISVEIRVVPFTALNQLRLRNSKSTEKRKSTEALDYFFKDTGCGCGRV